MTRLPDSETLKREVQRRISNEESFCMVYAEMLGLQRFGGACGNEYRDKAIRHFGRALKHCGDKLEIDGFFVGHMGGGYFVCLLPPEYAERFGKRFLKAWRAHLPDFYARCGKAAAYEALRAGQSSPVPLIAAVICMTEGNPDVARSPKEMFETLSRLRQKALLSGQGGIHADKRGAGPAEL
jgi:GGDEF domain-containing protein